MPSEDASNIGIGSSVAQAFLAEQEASGRVLSKREENWWTRFGELEEYKREHGDCNVSDKSKEHPQLGTWVKTQRMLYKQNKMNAERIEALESIGFEWIRPKGTPADDALWWGRFGELEEYKKVYGDCNVPINYAANQPLAIWVRNQRAAYARFTDANWRRFYFVVATFRGARGIQAKTRRLQCAAKMEGQSSTWRVGPSPASKVHAA